MRGATGRRSTLNGFNVSKHPFPWVHSADQNGNPGRVLAFLPRQMKGAKSFGSQGDFQRAAIVELKRRSFMVSLVLSPIFPSTSLIGFAMVAACTPENGCKLVAQVPVDCHPFAEV
jgi:hypothetical protein